MCCIFYCTYIVLFYLEKSVDAVIKTFMQYPCEYKK